MDYLGDIEASIRFEMRYGKIKPREMIAFLARMIQWITEYYLS